MRQKPAPYAISWVVWVHPDPVDALELGDRPALWLALDHLREISERMVVHVRNDGKTVVHG